MSRRVLTLPLLAAAGALLLAGCGSSSSSSNVPDPDPTPPPPPAETSTVRVVHASADAPDVNVLVNGDIAFEGVPFGDASPLVELDSGDIDVQVDGLLPGGDTATVIGPVTLTLEADTQYNVLAIGDVAAIEALVLSQEQIEVPGDEVRVRVVHAAPGAPEVDVYVTAPGDTLDDTPLGTFEFGGDLGPAQVPEGDYRIRVTVAGTDTVVYDTGAIDLPGGADLLIAAVTNTGPGDAPITLLVSDGNGALTLFDQETPADVRVVHNSPAPTPAVDVIVNDDFADPFVPNLAFPEFTPYVSVPPDVYNVKVTPSGNAGSIVIDADLDLEIGTASTVIALGELAEIQPLVLADDNRRIATEAKVRLVHGASSAGEVDVYVVPAGEDFTAFDPAVPGFAFLDNTGYIALAEGEYDVFVTLTGTTTVAIEATIDIVEGGVYTAIARDPLDDGSGEFGLILMDDF